MVRAAGPFQQPAQPRQFSREMTADLFLPPHHLVHPVFAFHNFDLVPDPRTQIRTTETS